jgi:hypothetical protein
MIVVSTSLTFGASLDALVSHPPLYGWNWNYALLGNFSGAEDLPAARTAALLDHDPDIAHWTAVYFSGITLDGDANVPALATTPNSAVIATPLSGHPLESANQIVLGEETLRALHVRIGSTVEVNTGGSATVRLQVVGTATLPTIGSSGDPALQMGTGAVLSSSLFSTAILNPQGSPIPGPNAALISIRDGVPSAAALASLNRINATLNEPSPADGAGAGGVVGVLKPAEIANYRSVGSTMSWLAGILAAGALGALGLTLIASVRRRRKELALLKALGFTARQLTATVMWQSSVSAVVGLVAGLPLGIALGRWLWSLFANDIFAVPTPTVPATSLILLGGGALLFANVVAAIPGQLAARTPTAVLLRGE